MATPHRCTRSNRMSKYILIVEHMIFVLCFYWHLIIVVPGVVVSTKGFTRTLPTKVDRPFLALIRDIPTNAVLFMGRMMKP